MNLKSTYTPPKQDKGVWRPKEQSVKKSATPPKANETVLRPKQPEPQLTHKKVWQIKKAASASNSPGADGTKRI